MCRQLPALFIAMFACAFTTRVCAAPIPALKDTFVRGGQSATNTSGGISNLLAIKADPSDSNLDSARKTLFAFDLSSIPLGQTVSSAIITVNLTGSLGGTLTDTSKIWTFNVYGITDESLDNWTEADTNWNNAPGNNTTSQTGVNTAKTVLVGTFSFSGEGSGPVNLSSPALDGFLNSDTNDIASFILVRATRGDGTNNTIIHSIASRESTGASGPLLSVPEPASILIFGGMVVIRLTTSRRRHGL